MSIHLVLYSNNEPYDTTKKLIIESIHRNTNKQVVIHDYNLEKIKQREWFQLLQNLPSLNHPIHGCDGRRDGYYNAWKAFITKEVYDEMIDGDILYYVDSSRYYLTGFTENIDKLCDIVIEKLRVAGSVGDDYKNNHGGCDIIMIWDKIIPHGDNTVYLNNRHVLNSWFLFKKCESNNAFINDWVYFSCYTDKDAIYPLVTYHHTVDQSIFNILVIKYKFPVFYHRNIGHCINKDKNIVLNIINTAIDPTEYFIYL